ncbi:MAG: DUF3320 domain-containing protein, partial [Candidatus Nanohaloarchaea archaeon]|nr:DUF3320 domain-containing protein [Candidatus Nanohaloarchaea archaeon]
QDLIEERRRDNPALDSYIREKEGLESFFVKRLEVVQGDERDIMLFSVGYGPDENGKITMNFGPLNHDGGERRLNVAVTRARDRVIVFSSLQPGDIDLSRTSATGVQHFKQYLEYAKHGEDVLSREESTSDTLEFDSEFEEAVYNALTDAGLDVDTQVQSAGYSIDLAIKHPDQPGKYVLGIECDGAAYHHSKTARDRDRGRQMVLEDLGWTIHRIWSPDWLSNKEREIEKIKEKVDDLVDGANDEHRLSSIDEEDVEVEEVNLEEVEGAHQDVDKYSPYSPPDKRDMEFSDIPSYDLHPILRDIVKSDAPIKSREAYKRAIEPWGISRIGSRIEQSLDDYVRRSSVITKRGDVLWLSRSRSEGVKVRRNTDDHKRDVDQIPQMEIAKAAYVVLESGYSMEREDLIVETARLFGFSRAGSKIQERVDEAIDWLIQEGAVQANHGMVVSTEDIDIDEVIFAAVY